MPHAPSNEPRWSNGQLAASSASLPRLFEDVLTDGPGSVPSGAMPATAAFQREPRPLPASEAGSSGGRRQGFGKVFHGDAGRHGPAQGPSSGERAFAHWTGRVGAQSEFAAVRELAGLPDASLSDLAAEFDRTPRRRRTDALRHGYAIALMALALLALCGLGYLAAPGRGDGLGGLERVMLLLLGVAGVALALGNFGAFRHAGLNVAHETLGMYVSVIDDQHPWLYSVLLLMNNKAANDYRLKVLAERGQLRGMDYPMMREIASVHEALQLTQTAHGTARSVQASGPGVHVGGLGKAGKTPLAALPKRVNGLVRS